MYDKTLSTVGLATGKNSLLTAAIAVLSFGCHKADVNHVLRNFKQVNLVANTSEYQPRTIDPTLINAFGIAWSPGGIAWVNSVGGHVSELYSADGDIVRAVNIPSPTDTVGGFPCGIVFSGGKGFNLDNGQSLFLFTGFDGVLSGWNPGKGNNAKKLRSPQGASYTGLAIGVNAGHNFIYGANFGKKKIDVWDTAFSKVDMAFVDPQLPGDFSPYNIQAIGDLLFVMYSRLGEDGHGVNGAGLGYVSVFHTDGTFIKRFASQGTLNNPWGITLAPASFLNGEDIGYEEDAYEDGKTYEGNHGGELKDPVILVGNFGDGRINVFTVGGVYLGQLHSHRHPIEIEGLWALSFAPESAPVDPNRLYFTAGPDKETDGVFGYLIKQ